MRAARDAPERAEALGIDIRERVFFADLTGILQRIKDLASIAGVRSNQLVGYGLVVGLDGSGDQTTQTPFTVQSIINMLSNMGVNLPPGQQLQLKNVAAVKEASGNMSQIADVFNAVPSDFLVFSGDDATALIQKSIHETADRGNVVIVSHAASFALSDRDDTLRVLVTAPHATRVEREHQGVHGAEAGGDEDRGH